MRRKVLHSPSQGGGHKSRQSSLPVMPYKIKLRYVKMYRKIPVLATNNEYDVTLLTILVLKQIIITGVI